jgi:hypothetical protein
MKTERFSIEIYNSTSLDLLLFKFIVIKLESFKFEFEYVFLLLSRILGYGKNHGKTYRNYLLIDGRLGQPRICLEIIFYLFSIRSLRVNFFLFNKIVIVINLNYQIRYN